MLNWEAFNRYLYRGDTYHSEIKILISEPDVNAFMSAKCEAAYCIKVRGATVKRQ
jgi:hypothetical protein